MQDKEKFYNASPMKYILLSDVINHPDHQAGRLLHIKESTADMVLKFFRSNIKNLKYQFNTKAKTIKINLEEDDYFNCFVVSKIHWLMHDFKVNGVSFAPQGFLQKTIDGDQFAAEIHPGTYRYHAMILAEMYNEYIIVADKENIFPDHKVLSFEEHNELVNTLSEHNSVDGIWNFGDPKYENDIDRASTSNLKQIWSKNGNHVNWINYHASFNRLLLRKSSQVKNIWIPYGE